MGTFAEDLQTPYSVVSPRVRAQTGERRDPSPRHRIKPERVYPRLPRAAPQDGHERGQEGSLELIKSRLATDKMSEKGGLTHKRTRNAGLHWPPTLPRTHLHSIIRVQDPGVSVSDRCIHRHSQRDGSVGALCSQTTELGSLRCTGACVRDTLTAHSSSETDQLALV